MSDSGRILVGPAGWSYRDWEGIVYPADAGSSFDRLAWIADWFDLVEINVSFYRTPASSTAASWSRRVRHNPAFRFSAKLHRSLTHEGADVNGSEMSEWLAFVDPLVEADRLAAVLVQFPWSFRNHAEGRERIEQIIDRLRPLPVAVEVRHGGFDDPSWENFLRGQNATWVAVDQPRIGDSLGAVEPQTTSLSYVRMHGRNFEKWFQHDEAWERYDYLYGADELSPWADRIRQMSTRGDVLVVMNNHWRGQAVANAVEMRRQLGQAAGVPPPLAAVYPERFAGETLF